MDAQFWHERWQRRELGFHREEVNPLLRDYLPELGLQAEQTVLVPLCGKTRDIAYLLSLGLKVIGVELSETAVAELFQELEMVAAIRQVDGFIEYSGQHLKVYVGDFFATTQAHMAHVDVVYDRAALVALPELMRSDYTAHLQKLTAGAPQLLVTYTYDQSVVEGPPFAITHEEVERHYAQYFVIDKRIELAVEGGMKGKTSASESVYILRPLT